MSNSPHMAEHGRPHLIDLLVDGVGGQQAVDVDRHLLAVPEKVSSGIDHPTIDHTYGSEPWPGHLSRDSWRSVKI